MFIPFEIYSHVTIANYLAQARGKVIKWVALQGLVGRGRREIQKGDKRMLFASKTDEIQRGMEILKGIVSGVALDYELTDCEVAGLAKWLSENGHLLEHEPFSTLATLITDALSDGVLDADEREEILDWCLTYTESEPAKCFVTRAVRQLIGLIHGLTIDGKVTENEIRDLNDWLLDFESCSGVWPFNELRTRLDRVLADGRISESERQDMETYLRQFSFQEVEDRMIHDTVGTKGGAPVSNAPIYESFTALCDRNVKITFEERCFCFTGQARTGARKELCKLVMDRGGTSRSALSRKVHYLVIGGQSNPNWVYQSYGRKIEAAEGLRRDGHEIFILHEDDFVRQL